MNDIKPALIIKQRSPDMTCRRFVNTSPVVTDSFSWSRGCGCQWANSMSSFL